MSETKEKNQIALPIQTATGEEEIRTFDLPLDSQSSYISQARIFNALAEARARGRGKKQAAKLSDSNLTIQSGDAIIQLTEQAAIYGLTPSSSRFLVFFNEIWTRNGGKSAIIRTSLDEVMQKFGLTDRKETAATVDRILNTLKYARIEGSEFNPKGQKVSFQFMNVADFGDLDSAGNIIFRFGETFFNVALRNRSLMYVPKEYYRHDLNKYPHLGPILLRCSRHKTMNYGKSNENIVKIRTLLESAKGIPSREEIAKSNRNYQRIIEKFEKNLAAISSFSYIYLNEKGTGPLSDKEKTELSTGKNFDKWLNTDLSLTWHDHEVTESKKRRLEEKKKQTGTPKKRGRPAKN